MSCMSFQLFGVVITCCLISLIKSFSFIGLSTIPFTGGLFPLLNLTSVTWARALAKISRNSARPIWWWWCCWCWWRWRCCGTHQAWFDDDNVGDNYIDCCDNDDDDDDDNVELTTPGSIANSAWTAAALKAITACMRFNRCTRDYSSYNVNYGYDGVFDDDDDDRDDKVDDDDDHGNGHACLPCVISKTHQHQWRPVSLHYSAFAAHTHNPLSLIYLYNFFIFVNALVFP